MTRNIVIFLFGLLLLLSSCGHSVAYNAFVSLPMEGWHEDSVLSYDVCVADSTMDYDILIVVRHTNKYAYQNLWLFVDEYAGDQHISRDTIEAMVADDYGRWISRGFNTYELPLQYATSYRFASALHNRITIQQGMRTSCLKGISDVGIKVIY